MSFEDLQQEAVYRSSLRESRACFAANTRTASSCVLTHCSHPSTLALRDQFVLAGSQPLTTSSRSDAAQLAAVRVRLARVARAVAGAPVQHLQVDRRVAGERRAQRRCAALPRRARPPRCRHRSLHELHKHLRQVPHRSLQLVVPSGRCSLKFSPISFQCRFSIRPICYETLLRR